MSIKKIFTIKKILWGLLIVILAMQFFRIDKTNPAVDPASDFIGIAKPTTEVSALLKSACYDCHSHETKYPWYTNIAPVSWWLKDHINEGREELNFSTWSSYPAKKQDKKLKECVELIKEKEMPLPSYTWIHSDARLTDAQRVMLTDWFNSLRGAAAGGDAPADAGSGEDEEGGED